MAKRKRKIPVKLAKKVRVRRSLTAGETAMTVMPPNAEDVPLGHGFRASVNGLTVEGKPTFDDCVPVGNVLRVLERGAQFSLGDYVNYLEERFGEQAAQIIDESSGWALTTIQLYGWLARRVPAEVRRMDRLGVRHHLLVAALTIAQQRKWLAAAADDLAEKPWTVARLTQALREGEDLLPTAWFVIAACQTAIQQEDLIRKLELEGFACKATVGRRSKAASTK